MIAHRDYRNDISDAIGIMIEEAENGHSITYEEMEGAYHKLYHKLPESLIQGQFRELCSKNTDELKALFNHQRASESTVGDQLITYIEDGIPVNTKNVTDVAARIREKMNRK